ncbi:MAG: sulfurtransferase TusA family protein, partial [bacterium]
MSVNETSKQRGEADELNLENEVCPYTFVKSKLALEKLDAGEVLKIHLGNSESASNVPRSLDLEGHEVVSVDKPGASHWVVTVRR